MNWHRARGPRADAGVEEGKEEAVSEYNRERYRNAIAVLRLEAGGKCEVCGSTGPLYFRRRSGGDSGLTSHTNLSLARLREMAKDCALLCPRCSRDLSLRLAGKPIRRGCGTLNGYRNGGCRCDACRAANTAQVRLNSQIHRDRVGPDGVARGPRVRHGTSHTYRYYWCRCPTCVRMESRRRAKWNRNYRKKDTTS